MASQDYASDSQDEPPKPPQRKRLPAWLDHFNAHDLKILFRCWAAIWICTILIFIQPALDSIGLAAFLGGILLFIVPPASILFVYLLAALSLLLGMCLAATGLDDTGRVVRQVTGDWAIGRVDGDVLGRGALGGSSGETGPKGKGGTLEEGHVGVMLRTRDSL
ncbi:hypothetical protein NM208_g5261 [Fusarium decemcellulare]|uniref:Uncharacterized protein n=1 Tax=Fusarium decemcellulare TaxID=57161 RepID=A0ACC1SHW5_9HYPO|nr:hypothetical protein NM208_g5261 [Fusarium decemcellulare]